jgi:hypothetical protein
MKNLILAAFAALSLSVCRLKGSPIGVCLRHFAASML